MQGFILKVTKIRDEDCIVHVLSENMLIKCYRFYGVRHSSITQGYKIDFELENNIKFLPRLKDVMHLGFLWLNDRKKLIIWQQFIRLFYGHLKDAEIIDKFYFDILQNCTKKISKQNPKRVILESYIQILEFEGRLHKEEFCFLCENHIEDKIALVRAFLPAHEKCVHKNGFDSKKIWKLFKTKKSIELDDDEVQRLYAIILEGL